MTDIAVSVVIPTLNRLEDSRRAIRCVLTQSVTALEVILVDDGSNPSIDIAALAIDDPRLKVVRLDANKGGAYARNVGVKNASGRYIAFLDSDDEWRPQKLERQLELAKTMPADRQWLIYGIVERVERHKTSFTPTRPYQMTENLADFLISRRNIIQTSSLFMRVDTAKQFPFDETLRRHQDLDLLLNMSEAGVVFACVNSPDVVWQSDASDTTRVSSGANPDPTIYWVTKNRRRLPRLAIAELYATIIGPKMWKRSPSQALKYFAVGFLYNPQLLLRAAVKLRRKLIGEAR